MHLEVLLYSHTCSYGNKRLPLQLDISSADRHLTLEPDNSLTASANWYCADQSAINQFSHTFLYSPSPTSVSLPHPYYHLERHFAWSPVYNVLQLKFHLKTFVTYS